MRSERSTQSGLRRMVNRPRVIFTSRVLRSCSLAIERARTVPITGQIQTLETVDPPAPWHHLKHLLVEIGRIVPIRSYNESFLSIQTPDVLARIERGDPFMGDNGSRSCRGGHQDEGPVSITIVITIGHEPTATALHSHRRWRLFEDRYLPKRRGDIAACRLDIGDDCGA